MKFKDYFSDGSSGYAAFRPRYPTDLFAHLASLCHHQDIAWDCATGSGQAAPGLAEWFSRVWATDASARQIANSAEIDGVAYKVATAENSGLESGSVDLVTVAQALHWFDIEAFCQEVRRVLREGGVLAVWTYGLLEVQQDIDQSIDHLYRETLDSFWPPERKLVEEGYANIQLPMDELACPSFEMSATWDFPALLGYLGTWSAVRNYVKRHGQNPLDAIYQELLDAWGNPDQCRTVRWHLATRLWRNNV